MTSSPVHRRAVGPVAVAAVLVVIDQISKHWAVTSLADGRIIELVGTLQLRLAFNTGMSFGLGAGWGPLIAPLAALVVVGLLLMVGRIPNRLGLLAVGLVMGGAIGNLIDRVFRAGDGFLGGGVVDFIDLQWWPVFNVADMAIVVGAILLAIATWSADDGSDTEQAGASRDAGAARDSA